MGICRVGQDCACDLGILSVSALPWQEGWRLAAPLFLGRPFTNDKFAFDSSNSLLRIFVK
jgi:hypothetical protein